MSRKSVGLLVLVALAGSLILGTPSAEAHADGCLTTAHQGPAQAHLGCTSSPRTCLANVAAFGAHVLVNCTEPENHPCLIVLKLHFIQYSVCM